MENIQYDIEVYKRPYKKCPLDGKDTYYDFCLKHDCTKVNPERYKRIVEDGHTFNCRCAYEEKIQREEYRSSKERQLKKSRQYRRILESIQDTRNICFEDFNDFCSCIENILMIGKMDFEELCIRPSHDEDTVYIVALFSNETPIEFCVSDNIISVISKHYTRLKEQGIQVSWTTIPKILKNSVKINLLIRNKLTVNTIGLDDPVYVTADNIGKWANTVYGLSKCDMKRIIDAHLELSEAMNNGRVIYIKQELDKLIRTGF